MEEFIQHILNGLNLGMIYALVALGYTMVYGILQLINFAHSDVYMIGAFAAYYGVRWAGLEGHPGVVAFGVALASAIATCALLAYTIERLAYRPLRKAPKLNILITAIGVSLLLQYGGQVVFGADPKVFPQLFEDVILLEVGEVQLTAFDTVIFSVALATMLTLHWVVQHTLLGKAMRAVSMNPAVAGLLGIPVNRIVSATFVMGAALAAVGAVLVGMKYPKIDPMLGMLIGLKAFVAAVLGGIGNLHGAVLGGLIMGLSEEMVVAYGASSYRDALAFVILIVILIFRPAGLLGKAGTEKV